QQSPGGAGDLLLVIHVQPHPLFRREGDDLHIDVPITVAEAVKGERVRVPTFEGDVAVKVPPHSQSGTTLRVRGKGVTRKGRPPGDLYVRLVVHVPTSKDPELTRIAEEMDRLYAEDVRAKLKL